MPFDPNMLPPISDERLAEYEKMAESTEGDPDLLDAIGVLVVELKRLRQNSKEIYAVVEDARRDRIHHLWNTQKEAQEDAVARANGFGITMRVMKGHLVLNPL